MIEQSTNDSHALLQQRALGPAFADLAQARQHLDAQAHEIALLTAELQTYRSGNPDEAELRRLLAENHILRLHIGNALEYLEATNPQAVIGHVRQELLKAVEGK